MSYATDYAAHSAYLQKGYEAALAALGLGAVVLCRGAAPLQNRFDDQTWPLSVTP